jgi:hypothetical protein
MARPNVALSSPDPRVPGLNRYPSMANFLVAALDRGPSDAMGARFAFAPITISFPGMIESLAINRLRVLRQYMTNRGWQVLYGGIRHIMAVPRMSAALKLALLAHLFDRTRTAPIVFRMLRQ